MVNIELYKHNNQSYFTLPKKYFSRTIEPTEVAINPMDRYTMGLAVPRKGSKRACLCEDSETYSSKCCRERLINQGIGAVQGEALPTWAFRRPDFSNAFS